MTTPDTISMVKEMMTSPRESAARACAMLAENDDPRIRLFAEMWAQQNAESDETVVEAEPEFEPVVEAVVVPSQRQRVDLARLRERLYDLTAELRFARELLRQIACALGSCQCLGEDPNCEDCNGRAAPGTLDPEPAAFARYVLPALRKMKESRRDTAAQIPSRESTGRDETSAERSSS